MGSLQRSVRSCVLLVVEAKLVGSGFCGTLCHAVRAANFEEATLAFDHELSANQSLSSRMMSRTDTRLAKTILVEFQ